MVRNLPLHTNAHPLLRPPLLQVLKLTRHSWEDINSRTFLLKFGLPDVKKNILVESGYRIHITSYTRQKSSFPSHFVDQVLLPASPPLRPLDFGTSDG